MAGLLNLSCILQISPHDCGPTCFRIVCDYFDKAPPSPVSCPIMGVGPDYLEAHLRMAGLPVQFGNMTIADLKHHADQNRPVICLVNYDGEGHYICSRGISRGRVHAVCPLRGRISFSRSEFEEIWKDMRREGVVAERLGIAAG